MSLFTGLFIYKSIKLVADKVENFAYRNEKKKERRTRTSTDPYVVEVNIVTSEKKEDKKKTKETKKED